MKKWLHRTLIAALVVGLTLATLYEAATHVGRGWLRGEAFYEWRPTSYWRSKIDDWMERFDGPEQSEHSIDLVLIGSKSKDGKFWNMGLSMYRIGWNGPPTPKARPLTWVTRLHDAIRLGQDERTDYLPPKVLWGWYDADAVLSELAAEAKYRLVTDRAFQNIKLIKKIKSEGDEPTLRFDEPPLLLDIF